MKELSRQQDHSNKDIDQATAGSLSKHIRDFRMQTSSKQFSDTAGF